jgi:methanogenic corrinoid protein MtbC1
MDFVQCLLGVTQGSVMEFVQARRERGAPVESIYLELLAPAARLLGDYWTEDLCDFTEVTVALGRLHRLLNDLGHDVERQSPSKTSGLSIFLVPAPGEQHTLGLSMVGEFFRRSGWEVCGGPHATSADAIALLRKRNFDAVGFSLACEAHLEALAQSISSVRRATAQKSTCIIAGGPVFACHPEFATRIQADLIVSNGSEAPDLVKQFVLGQQVGA